MEYLLEQETVQERPSTLKEPDQIRIWRTELDGYYARMRAFDALDPVSIFKELAAISARASEIRAYLVRAQTRAASTFRTQEIDYMLQECDRQFKTWSRVVSVQTLDWEMTRGS